MSSSNPCCLCNHPESFTNPPCPHLSGQQVLNRHTVTRGLELPCSTLSMKQRQNYSVVLDRNEEVKKLLLSRVKYTHTHTQTAVLLIILLLKNMP